MAIQRLTDEDLVTKTGLTRPTIASIRNGEAENPGLRSLQKIADALGKDIFWLFQRPATTQEFKQEIA
jgi:transcriptional regulator with XRE-family HTH domain